MKREITGFIFNRIEEIGGKKFQHIGFSDEQGRFESLLLEFVPEIGQKKKAKITFELLE